MALKKQADIEALQVTQHVPGILHICLQEVPSSGT